MSNLSGYDSEVVGFESITSQKRSEATMATQTSEYSKNDGCSQTNAMQECGSMAAVERKVGEMPEYPLGLNEFLRRVVPSVLQQLDEGARVESDSDSEGETSLAAVTLHEMVGVDAEGDKADSVLCVSWAAGGTQVAVSVGVQQHEEWCTHDGHIVFYKVEGERLVRHNDVREKSCVTALRYHPTAPNLLASGSAAGEVRVSVTSDSESDISAVTVTARLSVARVSALHWLDRHHSLTQVFLAMCASERTIRSDKVLISGGSDGKLTVWRVNVDEKVLECIVSYQIDEKTTPDITCLDSSTSAFIIGTKSGALYTYRPTEGNGGSGGGGGSKQLQGHNACVLNVLLYTSEELFISLGVDGEMRVYDARQPAPVKVIHTDAAVSCMCLVGGGAVLVGGAGGLLVYDVWGRRVFVGGLEGGAVTALDVNGSCLVACGENDGRVRLLQLPVGLTRLRAVPDDNTVAIGNVPT